jgi:hypothetical protein
MIVRLTNKAENYLIRDYEFKKIHYLLKIYTVDAFKIIIKIIKIKKISKFIYIFIDFSYDKCFKSNFPQ